MPQKIAIVTEGKFEDLELFYPKYRFEEAGYQTEVLTPDGKKREGEYGDPVEAAKRIADADPADYAALHIPGGTSNADKLRMDADAVEFARRFWESGKPVFAICHDPWLLVETDVLEGAEMTSWRSLRKDCENAGASWVDREVVTSGRLVTSRFPPDLPHFTKAALGLLQEAEAQGRKQGAAQPGHTR